MDVDTLLDTHLQQQPALRGVIEKIQTMRAAIDGVEGQQYQRDKAATLVANLRQNTAQAIADELRSMLAEAEQDDAEAMNLRDEDERERVANTNGHEVDPTKFTLASTPAEISVLLNDAAVLDADSMRRAWGYAQPALKQMAAKEMRTHRMPSATSAFNALVVWENKMRNATRLVPDRAAMADTSQRRRRELRERILACCRLVALDAQVARLLLAADIQERSPDGVPAKGTMVMGRFFDQFKSR